jgi:hypothetical protein
MIFQSSLFGISLSYTLWLFNIANWKSWPVDDNKIMIYWLVASTPEKYEFVSWDCYSQKYGKS